MGTYTSKFIKNTLVVIAICIAFVAWQLHQNPEGMFLHYFFGTSLMIIGTVFNGVIAILSAIEDKEDKKEKVTDEKGKEVLKG